MKVFVFAAAVVCVPPWVVGRLGFGDAVVLPDRVASAGGVASVVWPAVDVVPAGVTVEVGLPPVPSSTVAACLPG